MLPEKSVSGKNYSVILSSIPSSESLFASELMDFFKIANFVLVYL